jgi:hypothetical protein
VHRKRKRRRKGGTGTRQKKKTRKTPSRGGRLERGEKEGEPSRIKNPHPSPVFQDPPLTIPLKASLSLLRLISKASIFTTGIFKRFPFNNFTYCLTVFSKFFSSFPHGTCSLSVSRRYLALDEIYHPFWAAFPSNPTLGVHPPFWKQRKEGSTSNINGIVTLSDALFQGTW